jgi:Zn-finger nucleic acid-binding protein
MAIDMCPTCGSVWLDPDEVEQLLGYELPDQLSSYRAAWKSAKSTAGEADVLSALVGAAIGALLGSL